MEAYTTVKKIATVEMVEKRSRFIGAISPVKNEDEAAAFLAEIRSKNWDASHNCSAYVLRGNVQRYSDDGEPQGTAGMPMLEILRKEKIVDAIVVVTRYFGGTLLGAGGLVRAYSHTAKLALDAAGKLIMQPCTVFSLEIPYPIYDRINAIIETHDVLVLHSDFGVLVTLKLRIITNNFARFEDALTEISAASVRPVIIGEEFA